MIDIFSSTSKKSDYAYLPKCWTIPLGTFVNLFNNLFKTFEKQSNVKSISLIFLGLYNYSTKEANILL